MKSLTNIRWRALAAVLGAALVVSTAAPSASITADAGILDAILATYTPEEDVEPIDDTEITVAPEDWEEYFLKGYESTEYSNYRYAHLDEDQQWLYEEIYDQVLDIAYGNRESTEVTVTVDKDLGDRLDCMSSRQFDEFLSPVVRALYRDCPFEFYWNLSEEYGYGYNPFTNVVSVRYYVGWDYSKAGQLETTEIDADGDAVQTAIQARANAAKVVHAAEDYSLAEALIYFDRVLRELVDYDYELVFGTHDDGFMVPAAPHSMVPAFDDDPDTNIVCEGYAKAYQYLFESWKESHAEEAADVNVYTIGGEVTTSDGRTGGHMWNIISTTEGNYVVDVTNDDDQFSRFMKEPTEFYYLESLSRMSGYKIGGMEYHLYDYVNNQKDWYNLTDFTESEIGICPEGIS